MFSLKNQVINISDMLSFPKTFLKPLFIDFKPVWKALKKLVSLIYGY